MTEQHTQVIARGSELTRQERRWVELACLAVTEDHDALDRTMRTILSDNEIDLARILEFSLQYAVYCGWAKGAEFELAIRTQWKAARADRDGGPWPLQPAETVADWDAWHAAAEAAYSEVNRKDIPRRDTPFVHVGVLGFVFGHVWQRPGLSMRERRVVALACCAAVGARRPLQVHLSSALTSGDLTRVELAQLLEAVSTHVDAQRAGMLQATWDTLDGPDIARQG
ncbi:carboxymuconolactone decarboxylase family protein [Nocardia sp.]|uniref:carboxymuconolactone decarboxylase family protein n=1 Tax=Nocardia sp. TaxID=1821 RepID=UPI00261EB212|nr:carboxymuconolactone decarboxylase family protein [Nocardia sp.]